MNKNASYYEWEIVGFGNPIWSYNDTVSHWHDFNRQTGHRTNTNSHQTRSYASGDLGFEFSTEVQKEITWKA